ncbi:unnamed protein product [Effrenium voratum]|uniref:Uncharacterized protein n=1 Tax=Effrenium voratum TaxID=2562239 RepID=A0AA36N8Z4_9DINO|nr:unnamed protein product [Effrenium voratum]
MDRWHLHVYIEFHKAPDWTSLRPLAWRQVLPNCSPCRARGAKWRESVDQGHFYCWAAKVGSLRVQTSGHEPWVHYTVRGAWLDSLWSSQKLTHDIYLEYACKVRVGFVGRLKQVEAVQLREQQQAFQGEKAAADAVLETLKRPFKQHVLELVREWASQYSMPLLRYKFLVLRAGSRCGKSTLAKSLHQELAWLKPPYIQTVQDDVSADLRGFNRRKHGFLVFDNINNMSFILSQRALFQSNGDVHTLGQSKTGVYSYDVYLYRIPIVFTVDHAATWDSLEPWMAENMVLIELSEPCFVEV